MKSTKEHLRSLLIFSIQGSGMLQGDVAMMAGITPKHLSCMVNGHAIGSLDVYDRLFAVLGYQLEIEVVRRRGRRYQSREKTK